VWWGVEKSRGCCAIFTLDYGVGAAVCFGRDVLICERKNSIELTEVGILERGFLSNMVFYA
jgi:hypothetical protein